MGLELLGGITLSGVVSTGVHALYCEWNIGTSSGWPVISFTSAS